MSKKRLFPVPKVSSPKESKKKIGYTDPKNPWGFCFKHEGSKRTVNFADLISHAKRKSVQKNRPDLAEDFSQWAVLANLERINNGNTQNGHLNNVNWLWNDYIEKNFGAKHQSGNRWNLTKNTFSYDNLLGEDGSSFLELISDKDSLNPEESLILKEDLASRADEVAEALRDKKKERKEMAEQIRQRREQRQAKENHLYCFFKGVAQDIGFGVYVALEVRKALGLKQYEFKTAISNLEKSGKIIIKSGFFYLPAEINALIAEPTLKKVG